MSKVQTTEQRSQSCSEKSEEAGTGRYYRTNGRRSEGEQQP